MKLYKIIENLEIIDILGDADINISNIHYDSRKVNSDSLFVCIKGFNNDSHKFIDSVYKKGTKAFLIDEYINDEYINLSKTENITFIRVKNTRECMGIVASNFYENPTNKLFVVGVTGTNGKTSITTFLKQILSEVSKVGIIGTINIDDGKDEIVSSNTTPEAIDLQRYFNNMIKNDCKYCAMEVSSHSLALNRVNNINFRIGIFTNLTPDHLDFHKDLDDYRDAKELLFYKTSMANIINVDDKGGQVILEHIKDLSTPCYTYSIEQESDFMAKDVCLEQNGVSYMVATPSGTENIYVPIPGKFTVYNTLAVIGACHLLNIPMNVVKEALRNINGVAGRFENIKNSKGITVIVDYAHTPDALENVLTTAKEFSKGKIITVFGCGGDRDKSKRPAMGSIAQKYSDLSIVTSDNPRHEDPSIIIEDILKGIDSDVTNYLVIEDRKDAINKAIEEANENDIVIIAGKGHEDYQIIGDTKHHFDDKEIAKKAIENKI